MNTTLRSGHISLAAFLTLAAGAAAGLDTPGLTVTAARSGNTLSLGDATVTTTRARILNQRVFTFPNSRTVLVTWDEAAGAARTAAYAISLDGGRTVAQVGSNPNMIRLRYASFDPLAGGEPVVPAPLAAGPGNELFLVQFVATPLDEMRAQVEALGGIVLQFLTDNTHIIRMTPEVRAKVAALPYVRWTGPVHPAYRLDEATRAAIVAGAPINQSFNIAANRMGPQEQGALSDLIIALGGKVQMTNPDQYRMEATLNREQLLAVLHRNETAFVDPAGPMEPDMDLNTQQGGAVPILGPAGFRGQGVRGEVFDTHIEMNHQQWNGQAPLIHGAVVPEASVHGSQVYGINFATGTGNAAATGLLPEREQGIFYYYKACNQGTFGGAQSRFAANTEAVDPAGAFRSSYQTSSIGSPQTTAYTTISAEVDDYLFRVDYLSCQSQSNTGSRTSRPQAWAKNIVSVGGVALAETLARTDDAWATGSSFGPASDLRVKPDLVNSYNTIFTTTDGVASYTNFCCTSGATPITAGHFGLLTQMWHQGQWNVWNGSTTVPTGGAATVFLSRPKSQTAKALMINGAFRYSAATGGNTNIRERQRVGWGMADFSKLYPDRAEFFIVNQTDVLTNAQTRTYNLTVGAGEPEFRVTMIYPDPQGTVGAAQLRVNDISLKVTAPDGVTVYWGNNGMVPTAIPSTVSSNFSTAGGAANTYDTVENVFIQSPAAGTWKVEVIASQIVADGYLATPGVNDAVFSLVASNVTLTPPPAPCYANCDASTAAPVLNVADFTCFLQQYALGDSYANCDASTSPPELNVADFTCFLQKYALGCP